MLCYPNIDMSSIKKSLKPVYYRIFKSHLRHASFFWAQNTDSVKRFNLLQKKSPKHSGFPVMGRNSHTGPILKTSTANRFFT